MDRQPGSSFIGRYYFLHFMNRETEAQVNEFSYSSAEIQIQVCLIPKFMCVCIHPQKIFLIKLESTQNIWLPTSLSLSQILSTSIDLVLDNMIFPSCLVRMLEMATLTHYLIRKISHHRKILKSFLCWYIDTAVELLVGKNSTGWEDELHRHHLGIFFQVL